MQATVPTSLVDNEYELFPEGTFVGELASATRRDNDEGDRVSLRVSLANTRGLGGDAPETGGRTFSDDIVTVWDGISVAEVSDFSDDSLPYPLRLGAARLAGLAEACGAAQRGDNGVAVDFAAFVEALQEGEFEDREVAFEVNHRSYENNDGEEVTRDEFQRIGPAA